MLVVKKPPAKKTAAYVIILVLTVGATFLIIMQNRGSAPQKPVVVDNAAQLDIESGETNVAAPATEPTATAAAESAIKAVETSARPRIGTLDLSIFENPKFIELQNITVARPPVETGKRDPFKPN